jgi:RNA polymerase sigma factor (sigma-70 family)
MSGEELSMGKTGPGGVVRLIQTLWDTGTVGALDDAQLLERFLRDGAIAEAAFAALVRRHAPMVLRICRDVTGDPHDAQDAAQVTFLILAQKARSIRSGESMGNWLFGTARRVAARALRDEVRRRRHERRYAETITWQRDPEDLPDERESERVVLYDELAHLPERYRTPIVLCDLEGLTHEQAADRLKCPRRTLETRLYRGRERLRRRMVRHGLLPAVELPEATFHAKAGPVAVPASWVDATTVAAMGQVAGRGASTVASEAVILLFRGVHRAMFLSRLKWTAAFLVIIGFSAGLTFGLAPIGPRAGRPRMAGALLVPRQSPDQSEKTPKARPGPPTVVKEEKAERPGPMTTPITVRGRAIDIEGKPVAGATIELVSTNGTDAPLGTTTTDRDGAYIFRNARLPVARFRDDAPLAGTFQVYGAAPGRGFAWHGMRSYQPRRRPDDWRVAGEDYMLFGSDPKVMDLRFPPAATLGGQIVDEAGRPVPDARIRIGHCDYLDTQGKESHHNFREFWAIHAAPAGLTTTKTGADGRFRLEGLPKEAGFWVFVEHPDYARMSLYAATTDRPSTAFEYPRQATAGHERPPVATGELKVTLRSTRRIAVRTVFANTGRPAPKVRVSAGNGTSGPSANGTTDVDGRLLFRLPPGEYGILADPTEGGAECMRTRSSLRVDEQPAEQSLEVRVKPGCVLILEVVDAKTGKGVPGVGFYCDQDDRPGSRASVQSRSGYIDHPVSDADGRLRAVVEPGERVYAVGPIPESTGYRQQNPQKRVAVPAGGTVTVRFELQP